MRRYGTQQTILFSLGGLGRGKHCEPVNYITGPRDVGLLVTCAEDTDGMLTTVGFRQLEGWRGVNLTGHQAASPYPAYVMEHSFYVGDGDHHTARIRIEGLTPREEYTFTFFASRMESNIERIARYRIGAQAVELDASNNTNSRVSITAVSADADGTVTVEIECAEDRGYAYLGVLEIEGKFRRAEPHRDPPDGPESPPLVSAKAWAIADGTNGELLWGDSEQEPSKIASISKIMSASVILKLANADPTVLEEAVTVSELAANTGGSSADLRAGESVSVGDLLYGLLLPSGNDAGNALAEHFNDRFQPPDNRELRKNTRLATRANFVGEMNRNAQLLGMANTMYRSPYHDGGTRYQFTSTPRDLLKLTYAAMREPLFRNYVGTRRHACVVNGPGGRRRVVVWRNQNQLLGIEGYDGVKTGTSSRAGACLVASGRHGSDHLLAIVLGAPSSDCRYVDVRNILQWAWRQRGNSG